MDYPALDPWSYAVTVVTPTTALVSPAWAPTSWWLQTFMTVFKVRGWILTALFLAGITGLLRKG